MRKYKIATGLSVTMFGLLGAFQNCGQGFKSALFDADSESSVKSYSLAPTYVELKEKIFDPRCASCHAAGGAGASALDMSTYQTLMANATAVQPPSPTDSELYLRVADHTMPPGGPLAASQIQAIANWILAYAPEGTAPPPTSDPSGVPNAPANLRVLAQGDRQVDLAWDDLSANETEFVVERSDGGGGFGPVVTTLSSVTSARDLGLGDGVTYVYRVAARNARGTSAYSNTITVVMALPTPANPPPNVNVAGARPGAAPTNLHLLAVTGTAITVAWTDNSSDETQFQLELSTDGVVFRDQNLTGNAHPTEPNALSSTAFSLMENTKYFVRVRADFASRQSAVSNTLVVNTPGRDVTGSSTPMTLALDRTSPNQVTFRQTAPGAMFAVKRSTSPNGPFNEVPLRQQTAAPGLYFTAAFPATQYYYRFNGADPLVTTPIKTPPARTTPPAGPSNLVAQATAVDVIFLYWTDMSDDEYAFEFQHSTDGITFTTFSMSGAAEEYWAERNLKAATTYYYRVRAVNQNGGSTFSNVAQATTWPLNAANQAPRDLALARVTDRTARVTYGGPTSGQLDLETSVDGTNFSLNGTSSAPYDAGFTALTPDTNYYVRLRTKVGATYSDYSNVLNVKTLPARAATPPPAPTALTGRAGPSGVVALSWAYPGTQADVFLVETSTDGSSYTQIANFEASQTWYVTGRGPPVTPLYARVFAVNPYGTSAASNVVRTEGYAPGGKPDATFVGLTMSTPTSAAVRIFTYATNQTGFVIETSTDGVNYRRAATVAANATTYTLTGLAPDTTYWVRARAVTAAGVGPASAATIVTDRAASAPPRAPDGLYVPDARSTQLVLTWNDNSNVETAFLIERSGDGVNWTSAGTVGPNVTQFKVTGLNAWSLYFFRVSATSAAGTATSEPLGWTTNGLTTALP